MSSRTGSKQFTPRKPSVSHTRGTGVLDTASCPYPGLERDPEVRDVVWPRGLSSYQTHSDLQLSSHSDKAQLVPDK